MKNPFRRKKIQEDDVEKTVRKPKPVVYQTGELGYCFTRCCATDDGLKLVGYVALPRAYHDPSEGNIFTITKTNDGKISGQWRLSNLCGGTRWVEVTSTFAKAVVAEGTRLLQRRVCEENE